MEERDILAGNTRALKVEVKEIDYLIYQVLDTDTLIHCFAVYLQILRQKIGGVCSVHVLCCRQGCFLFGRSMLSPAAFKARTLAYNTKMVPGIVHLHLMLHQTN